MSDLERVEGGLFAEGNKGGPGRPKGMKNQITDEIREAFQNLTHNNLDNIQKWLDKTATKNPAKALELYLKLSERILPTLQRTEQTVEFQDRIEQINVKVKRNKDDL